MVPRFAFAPFYPEALSAVLPRCRRPPVRKTYDSEVVAKISSNFSQHHAQRPGRAAMAGAPSLSGGPEEAEQQQKQVDIRSDVL